MTLPQGPNQRWSLDFVSDTLADPVGCLTKRPERLDRLGELDRDGLMSLRACLAATVVVIAAASSPASSGPERHDTVSALLAGKSTTIAYSQFRRGYRGRRFDGRRFYGRRYRRGYGGGALIGGLAAGALIGGALAAQAQPAPVYAAPSSNAPQFCLQRFKSYDPASGTYLGYDGLRHPCP